MDALTRHLIREARATSAPRINALGDPIPRFETVEEALAYLEAEESRNELMTFYNWGGKRGTREEYARAMVECY